MIIEESENDQFGLIRDRLSLPQLNYSDAKIHSADLDEQLGYQMKQVEDSLFLTHPNHSVTTGKQFWFGLDIQSLQTPYSEILEMIDFLNPKAGDCWVDLGAGYGRMGVVLGFLRPDVQFRGYESVPERTLEANRIFLKWGLQNAEMLCADVSAVDVTRWPANLYFIYDFGSKEDIYQTLSQLQQLARSESITVIARGRGVRNWILQDFPWLSQIQKPTHFENWSAFYSA
jgi:hypothetical protein